MDEKEIKKSLFELKKEEEEKINRIKKQIEIQSTKLIMDIKKSRSEMLNELNNYKKKFDIKLKKLEDNLQMEKKMINNEISTNQNFSKPREEFKEVKKRSTYRSLMRNMSSGRPEGVCFDPRDEMFVISEMNKGRLIKIGSDPKKGVLKLPSDSNMKPRSVVWMNNSYFGAIDVMSKQICVGDGTTWNKIPTDLNIPHSLKTVSHNNYFLVTDLHDLAVKCFDSRGTKIWSVQENIEKPKFLAVDEETGRIFVTDEFGLKVISLKNKTLIGVSNSLPRLCGITLDNRKNILAIDEENNKVIKLCGNSLKMIDRDVLKGMSFVGGHSLSLSSDENFLCLTQEEGLVSIFQIK